MQFRSCGDCTACCSGNLKGIAHGNHFGNGRPCVFLTHNICSIYKDRPSTCRSYQCAWTQNLLDEDLKPNVCGVMVSIETDKDQKQFLKAIELNDHVTYETIQRIKDISDKLNTRLEIISYHEYNIYS